MHEPVFVAQFDPPESTEARLANRSNEDPNLPEWNWCGICALRMVVLGIKKEAPSLIDMYQKAFDDYAVFRLHEGRVLGSYHKELALYARREFGLFAECVRGQSSDGVARLITAGAFFLASVSPDIRRLEGPDPERRNGHFVVVYGVREHGDTRSFLIHNSAGFLSLGTQSAVLVPESRFNACFSGNGIIVTDGQ